jgi:hypothetical protein
MAFGDLSDISRRTGINPRTARLSNGLSAIDLAAAMADEWKDWMFGCEAEMGGWPNWVAPANALIVGMGNDYTKVYQDPSGRFNQPIIHSLERDMVRAPYHYAASSGPDPFWKFSTSKNALPFSVTHDGSVSGSDGLMSDGLFGHGAWGNPQHCEVVSPPMTWRDGSFADFCQFLLVARGCGAQTNRTTGGHVHFDMGRLFRGEDDVTVLRRLRIYVTEWFRWEAMIAAAMQVHDHRYPFGYARTARPGLQRCMPILIERGPAGNIINRFGTCITQNLAREAALNLKWARRLHGQPETGKNTVELRLPNGGLAPQHWMANVQLGIALCMLAKHASRPGKLTPKDPHQQDANDRYDFHVWLNSLGMTGPEFSVARKYLLQNLRGDAAYKTPRRVHPSVGVTGESNPRGDFEGQPGSTTQGTRPTPVTAPGLGTWARSVDGFLHTYIVAAGQSFPRPYATIQEYEGRFLPIVVVFSRVAGLKAHFIYPSGTASDSMPIGPYNTEDSRFTTAQIRQKVRARTQELWSNGASAIGINSALWLEGFADLNEAKRAALAALARISQGAGADVAPPDWTGPTTAEANAGASAASVTAAAPMGAGRRGRASAAAAARQTSPQRTRARGPRIRRSSCQTAEQDT